MFGRKPRPTAVIDARDYVVVDPWDMSEKAPVEVARYCEPARQDQLRVISREDYDLYHHLQAEAKKIQESARRAPRPGPVTAYNTIER